MPTTTSPPILIWSPGSGIPGGPVSNPPVYSQAGITPLINGQSYVDVAFGSIQTTDEWVLVECIVVNEIDATPLNIWPGIITDKTTAGFRLQLNGMPDSDNYYLHWAVSGINITPVPATAYTLSGPSTGSLGDSVIFTVSLFPSTTLAGPMTVVPSDGGGGGLFSPPSVTLTSGVLVTTFAYTPASPGTKTISVTNNFLLTDPPGVVITVTAPTYTLTGPTTGAVGSASTPFTVLMTGTISGTVIVTPSAGGGGGTFTPTTVNMTTVAPSATFTYTPASGGAKTISVTNNRGLTNPGSLTYTATVPIIPSDLAGLKLWLKADALALADGAAVATWPDSSGLGNDVTQVTAGARPIFKTGIVNGKPVVRWSSAVLQFLNLTTPISGTTWTIFAVMKTVAGKGICGLGNYTVTTNTYGPLIYTDGTIFFGTQALFASGGNAGSGTFNQIAITTTPTQYLNGVLQTLVTSAGVSATDFTMVGMRIHTDPNSDGDMAELFIYNSVLSNSDRIGIENYLRAKYALP